MTIEQDLAERDRLRRYLNERSLESLAERFGISKNAVWLCEKRPLAVLTDNENAELLRLRVEYREALDEFNRRYRLDAIADKHGHSKQWVCRQRHIMLNGRAALPQIANT